MPDYSQMGLAGGLVPSRDTTNIDPKILAMLAMRRKQNGTDTTPKVNVMDDIKSANEGKRMIPTPDSTIKMEHAKWVKYMDTIGYEVVKKSQ